MFFYSTNHRKSKNRMIKTSFATLQHFNFKIAVIYHYQTQFLQCMLHLPNGKHTSLFILHTQELYNLSSHMQHLSWYLPLPNFHPQPFGSWYGILEVPSCHIRSTYKKAILMCWSKPGKEGERTLRLTFDVAAECWNLYWDKVISALRFLSKTLKTNFPVFPTQVLKYPLGS